MPQDKLEDIMIARFAPKQPKIVQTINGPVAAPRLPDFEPDPIMPANREQAKAVHEYLRKFSNRKHLVPRITTGPTAASIEEMLRSGLNPEEFADTNLMGIFDLKSREIGLNPDLKEWKKSLGSDEHETIAHEFAHASGILNEPVAKKLGKEYSTSRKQGKK